MQKVLDRGDNLEDLAQRSVDLEVNAAHFQSSGKRLKRKMWWQNCKMIVILIAILLVIVIAIIVYFATK